MGLCHEHTTDSIPVPRCVKAQQIRDTLCHQPQIAPELVIKKRVYPRSDVFGLGLVFDEMASVAPDVDLRGLANNMRHWDVEKRPYWSEIAYRIHTMISDWIKARKEAKTSVQDVKNDKYGWHKYTSSPSTSRCGSPAVTNISG